MISIIICSINKEYLRNVSENISKTIGVKYELLVWDNLFEKRGICAVYNMMAERAQFPLLCFLHEDIFFETDGWGATLYGVFRDRPEVGAAGLAGSSYKSAMYSGWQTNNDRYDYFNYSHLTNGVQHKERKPVNQAATIFPVVCVDGVFIACRRDVWQDIRFDEERLKGFHFYDIDYSVRAARKYGVVVVMNIDLVHITQGGDYGDRWIDAAIEYHDRENGRLPFYLDETPGRRHVRAEAKAVAAMWLDRLKGEKIAFKNKCRWIMRQRLLGRGMSLWYPIARFVLFRPMKLYKLQRLIKKLRTPS